MWIKTQNEATVRLKAPFMDEPVEFSSNGTANVEESVAERLVEEYDDIVPHKDDESTEEANVKEEND